MLTIQAIKQKIKNWIGISTHGGGITLRFKNESEFPILSLRVVITDQVHEFRGIPAKECTTPVMLSKSQLYFFCYIVTPFEKLYFEPNHQQLEKTIGSGEIIVSIFIFNQGNRKSSVFLNPKIRSFRSLTKA